MATAKRKVKKRAATKEDRLSNLPEALQLCILSRLTAKPAVQTSMLSKTWVSLWTKIPVLELHYYDFNPQRRSEREFEKFVSEVLCRRDNLAKLDILRFTHLHYCRPKILKTVFDYAFSHGIKHLKVAVGLVTLVSENRAWPVSLCDSLRSLKLKARLRMISCPFLGPNSTLFKNLTVLHLIRALITDVEPFSGFPVLKSVTLLHCHLWTDDDKSATLSVHSLRLSDLTIVYFKNVNCCELRTPRLRFFKYQGSDFPKHEGVTALETLEIDFHDIGYYNMGEEQRMFDDLMTLFCTFRNVKSLTIFSSVVHVLCLFPDELVRGGSPFRELKDLKMDVEDNYCKCLFHRPGTVLFESVKGYLLHNSPDAKSTITAPKFNIYG